MTAAAGPHDHGLPQASSVLAVCAHPDDESFGLGAVLDRFASSGVSVSVLCLTRGEASTLSTNEDDDLGELRRSELRAAAPALGLGRVELRDYPDGALENVPLGQLAAEVATMAGEVGADLLLVFDQGGGTGHPDHCRATEAALAGTPELPVLAWTLPRRVADDLNAELGTTFVGRDEEEIDTVLPVDRTGQRRAIACHTSQSADNPPLRRRLELLGEEEWLRWLRRPPVAAAYDRTVMPPPDQHSAAREWDRRYASTSRLFRAEADETLVELVAPLAPGRAVDLGAGEGRNSLWLASRGWEVTAVDISKEALGRLDHAATSEGLSVVTIVDDITTYLAGVQARGDAFDLVVVAYLHPEPAQRAELLHAAARAVAPGGYLFVVGHHRLSYGVAGPFDPSRLYTEDDLRQAAHGLQVLRLEQRHGSSDIAEPGTDVILWARRPEQALRPAS